VSSRGQDPVPGQLGARTTIDGSPGRSRSVVGAAFGSECVRWPTSVQRPDGADRVFQTLLNKPRFSWNREGQALLHRYKPDWYAEPPLPRVMPGSPTLSQRFRNTNN
jgi:hypothetical protein